MATGSFPYRPAAITPDTTYTIDHQFTGFSTDGNNPRHNAMTLVGPVLYGTTLTGGKHEYRDNLQHQR